MAEASAINQVTALGESMTSLTEGFQQAFGQMMDLVNQAANSMRETFSAAFTTMLESTTPFLDGLFQLALAGQSLNLAGPLNEINLSFVTLNETMTTSKGILGGLFDSISSGISIVSDLTTGLVNFANQETLSKGATNALASAQELLNFETLKGIGHWIKNTAAIVADTAAKTAQSAITGIVSAAQAALNLVMSMNPIALVVIAITALVAAFVLLWNNCEGFRNFFTGLWDTIVGAVKTAIDVVVGIFQGIVSFISDYVVAPIAGFFSGLWNGITGVFQSGINFIVNIFTGIVSFINNNIVAPIAGFFSGLWNGIGDGVKGMVNFVIGILNGMIKGFLTPFNLIISGLNLIPGVNIKPLSFAIPQLASGGVVTTPTYALIGEGRYPEAVMPLGNSPQMKDFVRQIASAVGSNSGEQVFNIYLDGKQITASVEKHQRERGAAIMRGGVFVGA